MATPVLADVSTERNQLAVPRPTLLARPPEFLQIENVERVNSGRRRLSFIYSYVIQALFVVVLVQLALFVPTQVTPRKNYQSIALLTDYRPAKPAPHFVRPPAIKIPAPMRAKTDVEKIAPPKLDLPKVATPLPTKTEVAKIQPPKLETGKFDSPPALVARGNPTRPTQLKETGAFSGSSAPPTIKAPVRSVQTGGFGDPNGLPGKGKNDNAHLVAASLGAFDLPAGPGSGNGTGGARGVRGVVASTGFGNGVAGPGAGDHGGAARGSIRQAGFGDSEPVARVERPQAKTASSPELIPVEVLAKPKPVYTDEARRLKIEGEVLLQVVFLTSGKVQVVRVVRGLGHGLDEAAASAAEKIHFKPAQHGSEPVDFPATIHIVFQLA